MSFLGLQILDILSDSTRLQNPSFKFEFNFLTFSPALESNQKSDEMSKISDSKNLYFGTLYDFRSRFNFTHRSKI